MRPREELPQKKTVTLKKKFKKRKKKEDGHLALPLLLDLGEDLVPVGSACVRPRLQSGHQVSLLLQHEGGIRKGRKITFAQFAARSRGEGGPVGATLRSVEMLEIATVHCNASKPPSPSTLLH